MWPTEAHRTATRAICVHYLGKMTLCIAAKKITKRKIEVVNYRAGLLLEPKERRESGEDKREFEELLKRDSEEFDRRRKR